MPSLKYAVQSVLKNTLGLKEKESVLILTDDPMRDLGRTFWEESRSIAEETSLLQIPDSGWHGHEPRKGLLSLLLGHDAAVFITSRSMFHSDPHRRATKQGVRIVNAVGLSAETLIRLAATNPRATVEKSRKIADIFSIGRQARITSPSGTDLSFSITRMKGVADTGFAVESGQATLFPGGEGSVSPVAESAEGTVVIDGSIPEIGRLSAPITVAVKKGFVYRVSGGPEADKLRKLFTLHGKQARNLAEVGIGTNPLAQVTGKTLEDEKALGTAHVAFGNNLSFEGKIGVRCHIDAVFLKPTLCIDGRCIVENGSINV